ncbi:MAG: RNA-binding protein [Coprobacillaceae bacterium]
MYEHFKGEEVFVKKVLEYKEQALYKQKLIVTNFLDPYHQFIVNSCIQGNDDLQILEEGGFLESESKKIIIAPSFYQIEKEDFQITTAKITYAKHFDTLKHSDVLGALMSLGISRDRFGDIVESGDVFYLAVDTKIFSYIKEHITKIKRSKVNIQSSEDIITVETKFKVQTHIVSSLRLDKIVSAFYKISRAKAVSYIHAGFVKVNHKIVVEIHYLCNNSDIISLKKHGRMKFVNTNRITKSNNHVVEGHKYL